MKTPVLRYEENPPPTEPAAGDERRESESFPSQLRGWQERVLNVLTMVAAALGLLALISQWFLLAEQRRWNLLVALGVVYLLVLVLAFVRRIPFAARAALFLLVFYGVGTLDMLTSALAGEGRIFLLAMPVLALLLLGRRAGIIAAAGSVVTLVLLGAIMLLGLHTPTVEVSIIDPMAWVTAIVSFIMLSAFVIFPIGYVFNNLLVDLGHALEDARERWLEVRALSEGLEQQVAVRTADLVRRSERLEAAAQVTREVAEIRDVDRLLDRAVNLLSRRFGFYHVAIYLLDQSGRWAVLRAASSEAGRRMMQQAHRVQVGGQRLVGIVAETGHPRLLRQGDEPVHFDDETNLAYTQAQLVLPMEAHGQLIAVLDIQSIERDAFPEGDIAILRLLADQLALTIENASLLAESQKALDRLSRYQVEETLNAWRRAMTRRQARLAYVYDQTAVRPVSPDRLALPAEESEVPQDVVVRSLPDGRFLLLAPVQVGGQTIGVLSFEARREWTRDEVNLVAAAVQQMGLALENARLLEETRLRAEQERLVAEITTRVRASPNLETILQTAVRELGVALDTDRTAVRLMSLEYSDD